MSATSARVNHLDGSMDKALVASAALKHRIPVIDRMMDVLAQLEVRENGATIRDLVAQLKLPRTTIYRILNSLQLHDMVRRDEAGVSDQGRRPYALSAAPGQRLPVHAGAASKLLLAYEPEAEIDRWLARPLVAFTSRTITDPKRLRTELARTRRLGWAHDKGENAPSILAYAAPVFDKTGKLVAAISVPFLHGTEASRMEEIRLATIAAGKTVTAAIQA